MSSDNEFEDPYNISSEEAVGPLEVENTDTIQAKMPSGNENKSICKSLSRHLSLLKSKVSELRTYLDEREAVQAIDDHEIEEIQSMSNWIKAKATKITTQWEEFLGTDYDDDSRQCLPSLSIVSTSRLPCFPDRLKSANASHVFSV